MNWGRILAILVVKNKICCLRVLKNFFCNVFKVAFERGWGGALYHVVCKYLLLRKLFMYSLGGLAQLDKHIHIIFDLDKWLNCPLVGGWCVFVFF